ncbi:MAG: hypothetical protein AAFO82_21675 [Bacteroidota bacterium]
MIAVDWYIDQLRRKINDSPAIEMTIPREAYRGNKRVVTYYRPTDNDPNNDPPINIKQFIKFIGEDHPFTYQGRKFETFYSSKNLFIPVDKKQVLENGTVGIADTANIVDRIDFRVDKSNLIKDELAILDIIATNAFKRPIYYAVTCQPNKMMGLRDYMQLEGLALRLIPVNTKSDPVYSVVGTGRVNSDKVYENVMEEFRWGNFDKKDLFVDKSYMPSVQSHRLMMLRTANHMALNNDKERAVALIDKYFEAFPYMNFPYDINALYFIESYMRADAPEKAKKHLEILAEETLDKLEFFESLSENDIKGAGSYEQDFNTTVTTVDGIVSIARQTGDQELLKKYQDMFQGYTNNTGLLD